MTVRGSESAYLPDLLRGNTEALLLFLIKEMGHTYGYQLIKEIGRRSEGFFRFKEGTVYPTLRKLENSGLLQGEWREMPNGQERRYYRITEAGIEFLQKKLAVWESFSTAMNLVFKPAKP
ncbi:MAG: PadR family transcriptional regulator [Chloroflexi bacterium]|nr:PadR family transcriptional regulator [Chloroflexota bacterium]